MEESSEEKLPPLEGTPEQPPLELKEPNLDDMESGEEKKKKKKGRKVPSEFE